MFNQENGADLEFFLIKDTYLGNSKKLAGKLDFLANFAQEETWDYSTNNRKPILYNYLGYTYDRLKEENKIAVIPDGSAMCFNTGLLTRKHGADIFAFFIENKNSGKRKGQDWYLVGFRQASDPEIRKFKSLPDVANYFTNPGDFIYDSTLTLVTDDDHIIDDNFQRFIEIGIEDRHEAQMRFSYAVKKIEQRVKRNYKLAIPQYYTDKYTGKSKIQLLLPLFLKNDATADLVLVVDKDEAGYVGKTILTREWAYINSRRIVKPEVDWLKL